MTEKCPDCDEEIIGMTWWGRCFTCGMKYMAEQGHEWALKELEEAKKRKVFSLGG